MKIILAFLFAELIGADTPGYCEGELAYPRCSKIDPIPSTSCERLEDCYIENGRCEGGEDEWCQDYTTVEECEEQPKYPHDSFCRCCDDDSSFANSCSWKLCDTLQASECREPDFPHCKWIHSCPGLQVTVEQQTNNDCDDCLSACRGLSSCCTGVGCICERDCSGGGSNTITTYTCPTGYTRRGVNTGNYICCPADCVQEEGLGWNNAKLECYCDSPVCASNGMTNYGSGSEDESSAAKIVAVSLTPTPEYPFYH